MAIESMGAASAVANIVQPSQNSPQPEQVKRQAIEPIKNEQVQQQVQQTQEISAEKLEAAIAQLNDMMASSQRSLSFSVDNSSDEVVVQVKDLSTDEVIRTIPNIEALRFAESFNRIVGLIFDKTT